MTKRDNSGEKNPNWKGGSVEIKCGICNSIFTAPHNSKRIFCSLKCKAISQKNKPAWNKGKVKERESPNYDSRLDKTGLFGEKNPMFGNHKSHNFSTESRKRLSDQRLGNKNPNWVDLEDRACPTCKVIFTVKKTSKRIYCTVSCSKCDYRNPMKNEITRKKMAETYKINNKPENSPLTKLWRDRREFMLERVRSRMIGETNPMKNPEIVIKSHMKSGETKKPNKLELFFMNFIEKNQLPFKYVGNGKFFIGSKKKRVYNPDFIHTEKGNKLLIEIGATHWHSEDSVKELIKDYMILGWVCLFFESKEIYKNIDIVKETIMNAL